MAATTPVYIELQEYGGGPRGYGNDNTNDGGGSRRDEYYSRGSVPDSGSSSYYYDDGREGDEYNGVEREEGGGEEGEEEEEDPFLYYAMAHEDEDEDEEDEETRRRNNRRNNNNNNGNNNNNFNAASGWQSKNQTSRVAKTLSKYLAVMKLTKERQLSSSDNSLNTRLNNSSSNSNIHLRQSSSSIQLNDDDLLRAVELGAEEQKCCSCLPKRLNHVYMCVLLGVLIFVAGGGLLVMGLLSDFEFLEATPHETRLLVVPNTRWFDCLSWRRFAIRQPRANNDRPKSASPVGEAEIYLYDSMPRYTSQPRITSQSRDVDLASDDFKIHYVQFFINAGGVVNFAWSFKTENNTGALSPIDVLWVKGTNAFESLAGLGPGEDTQEIRNTRISSSHYDHYSIPVKESDDYYLAFRRRTKGTPRMIGYLNTVVATPVFDLTTSIGKLATFGEMCFSPNKRAYAVLSTTHPGDADDVLYISYHYSKRYEFSMALAGSIAGVIFIPFTLFWIVMVCRERSMILRRKRMQDEENPPNAQPDNHNDDGNNNNNNNNVANNNNNNNNQAFGGAAELPQEQQQQQQPQPEPQGQPANQTTTTANNNLDEDWW